MLRSGWFVILSFNISCNLAVFSGLKDALIQEMYLIGNHIMKEYRYF